MLARVAMPAVRQKRSKLAPTSCQASSMVATGTTAAVVGSFMALLSFVDSAPRAYRLKVGNACPPISTSTGTSPGRPRQGKNPFLSDPAILIYLDCRTSAALTVAAPLLRRARAMTTEPTIIVVDDDPGIRESLQGLLRSVGLQVKAMASVPEFLKEGRPDGPACLVLDVKLPGR